MAIQKVAWSTTAPLDCESCANSPVILCIDPALVALKICPEQETEQPYEYSTINASLLCSCSPRNEDGVYRYTFTYDDSQLIDGVLLQPEDITGAFCRCCKASFVEDLAGEDIHIEEDEVGQQTLVTRHGCEYPIPTVASGFNLSPFMVFGNGQDGDVIFTTGQSWVLPFGTNVEVEKTFFFDNVTIDEGAILYLLQCWEDLHISFPQFDSTECGFHQLFVADTLTINGHISANGVNGHDSINGIGGCTGSSYLQYDLPVLPLPISGLLLGIGGYCGVAYCGSDGALAGEDPADAFVSRGDVAANCYLGGGHRGASGAGGGGVGNPGGIGAPNSNESNWLAAPFSIRRYIPDFTELDMTTFGGYPGGLGATTMCGGAEGIGGAGGSATGTAQGGGGGEGGTAGGPLYIAARHIIIGPNGKISANGGDGGNGGDGIPGGGGDAAGGGGGGSGGGGGLIYLVYETLTNNGTIEVNAGSLGLGGSGLGGYADGEDAEASEDGKIYLLNMSTGKFE